DAVVMAREEALDVAHRLADAVLVLDQRHAQITLAVFAEADAGRDRDLGFLKQQLRELERAELLELRRYGNPREHAGRRTRHIPAGGLQATDQDIAPLAVKLAQLGHAVLRAVEGGGRRDLDRRERSVVAIGLLV